MIFFIYKTFTKIFFYIAPLYLKYRVFKGKEDSERYKEKLSNINISRGDGHLVWIHAASIGEALSIIPIINKLEQNEKIKKILITTVTLSSSKVIISKLKNNKKVVHQFFPLDIPILIKKFINHWSPNIAIFVESEIWPNMIYEIKKTKSLLLLVNGRITKKSFLKWNLLKKTSKKIFGKFDLCIASNKETENYLKILGAKKVKNYGNIKFVSSTLKTNEYLSNTLIEKIKNKKIWCAASTHKNEEIFCAKSHILFKKKYNDLLTIIIPRHVNRVEKIIKELSVLNLTITLYSKKDEISDKTDILLVDTYGESLKFFNISKSVFIGGSLISHGGQNPIEASSLGCKIFHGPNINNFIEIYEYLKSLKIADEISSPEDLSSRLLEEFKKNTTCSDENINKIKDYGQNIVNNVTKDLNNYINNITKDEIF